MLPSLNAKLVMGAVYGDGEGGLVTGGWVHVPRDDTEAHIFALTRRGSKDTVPARGELL